MFLLNPLKPFSDSRRAGPMQRSASRLERWLLGQGSSAAVDLFFGEIDTRHAVLQYRIVLDRKSKWANEILRGHPPFRSEACENVV